MHRLELLAPARDAATAIEAIRHGADAVYMGASAFGARAAAGNSVEDIGRVCEYAHLFGVRVYITVNTIVFEHEISEVERLVWELYNVGVDALIVQDMSLLRMNIPPIELHASTQCDIRSPEKASFLYRVGFSRLVLARELTRSEIADIHEAVPAELEAFVHGALCVSYSGDCHAGAVLMGRSANRGECPQICRLRYSVTDAKGLSVAPDGHWLSLRDLCRLDQLEFLATAGVSSFKIEGRLKDSAYVKNVVAVYSRKLDQLIGEYPDRYCRSSFGRIEHLFVPDIERSFNRGLTSYFFAKPGPAIKMASAQSPKWIGQQIGTVLFCEGRRMRLRSIEPIANGDGIVWFGTDGRLAGTRVNRVEGNDIYTAEQVVIPRGTQVYRNKDKVWDDMLGRSSARRVVLLSMCLRILADGRLCLDVSDCRGIRVSITDEVMMQMAKGPQTEARRRILNRLGENYELEQLKDEVGAFFIPASQLTSLRRNAIQLLEKTWQLSWRPGKRRVEQREVTFGDSRITYHSNVANSLAEEFYRDHGVTSIEPALELSQKHHLKSTGKQVMTTRYCLRRELGKCIREGHKAGSWYLRATDGPIKLRLDFDCARCGMNIYNLR